MEGCGIVNVEQEEPLLGIQNQQAYSWLEPPDMRIGLSFVHNPC